MEEAKKEKIAQQENFGGDSAIAFYCRRFRKAPGVT